MFAVGGSPNAVGSIPELSILGSTGAAGLEAKPTLIGKVWIDRTSGAILLATYETLTSLRYTGCVSLELAGIFRVARHCINFAFGLVICEPFGSAAGALQSLQVSSGLTVLPVR